MVPKTLARALLVIDTGVGAVAGSDGTSKSAPPASPVARIFFGDEEKTMKQYPGEMVCLLECLAMIAALGFQLAALYSLLRQPLNG